VVIAATMALFLAASPHHNDHACLRMHGTSCLPEPSVTSVRNMWESCDNRARRLWDARVVDVSITFTPTCVMLSSLKPFCFTSLKNALRFSDHAGADAPGIQDERSLIENVCVVATAVRPEATGFNRSRASFPLPRTCRGVHGITE